MAVSGTKQTKGRPQGQEDREARSAGLEVGGQGMGQDRGMNAGEVHHSDDSPDSARGNDQKGGDRSNRAAHSGATGESHPCGGKNKPAPKDQDEKGMGRPRNR